MNKYILETLKDVGAPVDFEEYTGDEKTYIRFFYLPQDQFSANDDERYTIYYVQVDVFSPGNLIDLSSQVKKAMKDSGFRKNYEVDQYEDDTKLFHKVLRFYIIREAI